MTLIIIYEVFYIEKKICIFYQYQFNLKIDKD